MHCIVTQCCPCVRLLREWHLFLLLLTILTFSQEEEGAEHVWPVSDTRWLQITGCNWPGWWAGGRQWKGRRKDRDLFNEANEKDMESLQASRRIRAGSSWFRPMMLPQVSQPWGAEKGQGKWHSQNKEREFTSFFLQSTWCATVYFSPPLWYVDL